MSNDTIDKALDRHAQLRSDHAVLKKTRGGCTPEEKRQKLAMKDEMVVIRTARLPAFVAAELQHELDDRRRRLSLCSAGNRHSSSQTLRERLEADIEVLEEALGHRLAADEAAKKPRLVHQGEPQIPTIKAEGAILDRIAV